MEKVKKVEKVRKKKHNPPTLCAKRDTWQVKQT